jgi:adenosylcobinamide-GDP ribazoletransferase
MRLVKTTVLMLSMFTRIPMPRVEWSKENMRYMMSVFPFAGIIIGLFLWLWFWLSGLLGFGNILFAAGITLIPIAVTGGIHMEALCDTSDAIASRAPAEKKREILKDPHTGAFAVISAIAYVLVYFALASELAADTKTLVLLGLVHVMSRTIAGGAVVVFPSASQDGLLSTFKESSGKRISTIVLCIVFALCAAAMLWMDILTGAGIVIAAIGCLIYVFFMSKRSFGGMSGDIAGYLIKISEALMLAAIVIIQRAVLL